MKASERISAIKEGVFNLLNSLNSLRSEMATKVGYLYKVGDKVSLGYARVGVIQEVYTEPVTIEIDGTTVTKEASSNNPAYLIKEPSGHVVLKLGTELDNTSRDA